ncbi:prolyl oligopeptidase family serine peptidase [bacterium]|nr:prolyl oligopeptidase family serine peptidase [bacterium]
MKPESQLVYPETRKVDQIDDYHGTKVADPYRWLEDDHSPETKAWVEAENKVTFGYLEQIPERKKIERRLTKLWNYERWGLPEKKGDLYFVTRNDGLQNQSPLYVLNSLDAKPRLLLDPNKLSTDGTVALKGVQPTDDGKWIAYETSAAGSDWEEIRIRETLSSDELPEAIKWVKFSSVSWTKDGKGFFYSRYDEPTEAEKLSKANYFHKLYYHHVWTPQSEDKLIYSRPDQKDWLFDGEVTDDGRYLIITVSQGTSPKKRILYKDLSQPDSKVVELLMDFDAAYDFVGNQGTVFYFRTDLKAPRYRLIAIDTQDAERAHWKELIPESDATLTSVSYLGGRFIASYLRDAHSQVQVFTDEGLPDRELELPGIGTVSGFGGKPGDTETFYAFSSYTTPTTIYRLDLNTYESSVWRKPKTAFHSDNYVTEQVFYTSKDGTKVPMFVTYRKGMVRDGTNPTLLYGYGGFNISLTPGYSPAIAGWLDMGGVYCVANLRGGGEYGQEWHEAGTKLKKQNVFDDFIAAAEYLIAEKYTSTPKLAIYGGSNGGLLIGACENQRPDLFGACIPAVGVMDMLRFHKFTIGWAWTSDYGSSDDPEEFKALYAYSPYHNLTPGTCYPPTLITTADHDDRVVPAHSFKYAARLQEVQSCKNPVLIRIETRAGHGAGKPTSKQIEERADMWAFLVKNLRMKIN